jgi:hypothetical protein
MRRREFIAFPAMWIGLRGTAKARNSTGRLRRIGFLSGIRPLNESLASFEQGLREAGWQPGQNIVIEYRFGAGQFDRLSGLAAELAAIGVELIVAVSAPETMAAKEGTKGAIPIVFAESEMSAHLIPQPSGLGPVRRIRGTATWISEPPTSRPDSLREQLAASVTHAQAQSAAIERRQKTIRRTDEYASPQRYFPRSVSCQSRQSNAGDGT